MPVYIEHVRPYNPSGLKRYADLPDAAAGIARASHFSARAILAELRTRGSFAVGTDVWRVVTAKDMRARAVWAMNAADRMAKGDEVADLPD